jgi:threonine aldolase
LFYALGNGVVRFVTSFQTTAEPIAEVLQRVERVLNRR